MIKEIRTPIGLLDADVKTSYHVDWCTYFHVRGSGKVGLQDIFKEAYGKELEMFEVGNDTTYSFDVKKEKIDKFDRENMQECITKGGFEYYYMNTFMTDLVNRSILPAGSYVITVSW